MTVYKCLGIYGIVLSVWAVVQLTVMGYLYSIESTTLIEDVEPHEYINLGDFMSQCESNYQKVSRNCYVAALCYLGVMLISSLAVVYARRVEKKQMKQRDDDEYFCGTVAKKSVLPKKKEK